MAEKKKNKPRVNADKMIDAYTFEQLCSIQCTLQEISAFFMVTPPTMESWCVKRYNKPFEECFAQFSSKGKISLRRNQFRMSENNPTMAIWLGKQYLGQTDKNEMALQAEIPSDGLFKALQNGLVDKKDD